MRKLSKLISVVSVLFLIGAGIVSCYKGASAPSPEKTQIQAVTQLANAVDSADLLKDVQVKIDAVNSGITSEEQGKKLEKELNAIREKAQSPEIIKKIDEIIQQIEIQIVALKAKEDIKNSFAQLTNTINTLLNNIASFALTLDSKDAIQKTLDTLNKFLADIQYQKEMIAQLIKLMGSNKEWADAVKSLETLLAALNGKEKDVQANIATAVTKQKDFLSKDELEAKIAQKLESLLKEIGDILAKASIKFDVNKINTAESLINSIKVISDINQLDMIKSNLTNLEAYFKQAYDDLKTKRAELLAVIAKTESLFKEAQALNSSKLKEIEAYLYSLKQASFDSDIAKLEKLLSSISGAYISIAERQRQLKENAIKADLIAEYNDLKSQYEAKAADAQNALIEVQNALKQKEFIEGEIAKGNISEDLLKKLADVQAILSKTDLQNIAITIDELQQKITSLKDRSGSYVPEVLSLASLADQLDSNIEKTLESAAGALDSIADLKTIVNEGLNDIANEESPAKDEIAISEGENQTISEPLLSNLLRYAKVKKGEIIFYQFVSDPVTKTVSYKKRVKTNDGKYQIITVTKTITVKKHKKVPYKKWKLEFAADAKNAKQVTFNVYQSLYQNGNWSDYKLYGYMVLKDLWYDRFMAIVNKNNYNWIKILKK